MDETSSGFDVLSNTTVDRKGKQSVPLKSTGHEKQHFTMILSSKADGTKLKPYIVFKGVADATSTGSVPPRIAYN